MRDAHVAFDLSGFAHAQHGRLVVIGDDFAENLAIYMQAAAEMWPMQLGLAANQDPPNPPAAFRLVGLDRFRFPHDLAP